MAETPIDVFLHIIEFIDHPKDLLSLALTARIFHAIIIPQHIEYRHISCLGSSEHVWKHLSDTPFDACSRVRYVNILRARNRNPTKVPQICRTEHKNPYQMPIICDAFIQALSKMVNLKVFKFQHNVESDLKPGNDEDFFQISEAIGKAGCDLEELVMLFQRRNMTLEECFEKNEVSKGSKRLSLLYDRRPSLRKYVLKSPYHNDSDPFWRMLLNAPNLTHMTVALLPSHLFFSGYWPNLQHLSLFCFKSPIMNEDYTPCLQAFLYRHSRLTTLATHDLLFPGWAVESDDFLPNLKSFFATFKGSQPTITTNIAAHLVHLKLNELYDHLARHKILLPNLETCVLYYSIFNEAIEAFGDMAPNIQKLSIQFDPVWTNDGTYSVTTPDAIMDRVPLLAKLKKLRVLVGPFQDTFTDRHIPRLLKILYDFHGLLYTRIKLGCDSDYKVFRLERDDIAKVMKLQHDEAAYNECNASSWDNFYSVPY